jgi:hypothetical protein
MILLFASIQSIKAQVTSEEMQKLSQKIEAQNLEIQRLRDQLTSETSNLKQEIIDHAPITMVLFLFGAFCALWAQNTGRLALGWFFLGLILNVVTVIILLIINAGDKRRRN